MIKRLRQRLYLWRRFRNTCGGVVTKRKLSKALRRRLSDMSKTESYAYYSDPRGVGIHRKIKLENQNLRERRMIVSILQDMYAPNTPSFLGVDPSTDSRLICYHTK